MRNMKFIWITLISLTLFAFLLGYLQLINASLVTVLLFTTFIKGQLVIDYFMGLNNVALSYRLIPTIWLLLMVSMIALAYYLPI